MIMKKTTIAAITVFAALWAAGAYAADSKIAAEFRRALEIRDSAKMTAIVTGNKDRIPAEINALLDGALAPSVSKDEREAAFYAAEFMAMEYKNVTGDINVLKGAKKRMFESRLVSQPQRHVGINGVHIVESRSMQPENNAFVPDNIIIKKGDTVRWVNSDNTAHLLASAPVIGVQGIFSPRLEPGQSWEYRFEKPGEYYYVCFIHKVMYGKVTVEE